MSALPLLLPTPRQMTLLDGQLTFEDGRLIVLDSQETSALYPTAIRLQNALREALGLHWEIVAGTAAPLAQVGATLSVTPGGVRHAQGYELTITPAAIHIVAGAAAGAFYAVCTLIQILGSGVRGQESGGRSQEPASSFQLPVSSFQLPTLRISDWPDFPHRGVMLDVSRDRVPTMATLYGLVDLLASWKVNQFQLYTEHTFAYRNHPEVWAEASPFTGQEILALDAFCRERHIELVPNQNSFGHMTRWLIHDRYRPLADAPNGCMTRWGQYKDPYSLCPLDPGSLDLVRGLFDELLPHFSSQQLNVGCDETVDLGQVRSKEAVEKYGAGRVYLDFLLKIYREVKARGHIMQFWGDIIMEHPELAPELPRDAIALEWGYEATHPFDQHGAIFAASGVPFYVCPGTASWNTLAGRTANALGCLRNAAESGLEHGAVGYLNTDWGDAGHWQPLPVSYLGFAYGAAVSWACAANRDMDISQAISRYAFGDPTGTLGRIAYDLGNVYQKTGVDVHNSTVFFRLLQMSYEQVAAYRERVPNLTADGLRAAIAEADAVMARWPGAKSARQDAGLIRREYAWAADMLRLGAQRGIWMLGKLDGHEDVALRVALAAEAGRLIADYRDLWLARSRPGGLQDSVARMERMKDEG